MKQLIDGIERRVYGHDGIINQSLGVLLNHIIDITGA